jgi:hypothetical protein
MVHARPVGARDGGGRAVRALNGRDPGSDRQLVLLQEKMEPVATTIAPPAPTLPAHLDRKFSRNCMHGRGFAVRLNDRLIN